MRVVFSRKLKYTLSTIGLAATLALLCACGQGPTPQLSPPLPGELRLGVTGAFRTLDPAQASTPAERSLHALLYEGMLTFGEGLEPVPVLADSFPEPSPNGLIWIVRCRSGVMFHDDTSLTCADLLVRLEALRLAPDAITDDDVDASTLRGLLTRIVGLTLLDDFTLQIGLSEPFGFVPEALAHPAAAIARPDGIGTGSFVLSSLTETRATVEAYTDHWSGPAPAERVDLMAAADGSAQLTARPQQLGTVFHAVDHDPIGEAPEGTVRIAVPGAQVIVLWLNPANLPTSEPGVRLAIGLALDRQMLSEQIYGGRAQPAPLLIGPAVATAIDEYADQLTTPNVIRAREAQATAGWPDGFDAALYVAPEVPGGETLGRGIIVQLDQIYVSGTVTSLEPDTESAALMLMVRTPPDMLAALSWLVEEGGPAADDDILRQAIYRVQTASTTEEREAAIVATWHRLTETVPVISLLAPDTSALATLDAEHISMSPFGWLVVGD